MRTNYSGFALAVSMGLIVLLIGFLALNAGGLVSFSPEVGQEITPQPAAPGDSIPAVAVAYKPATPQEAAAIAAGEAIFKSNCAQCHAVNEKVVGPALGGIEKRRPQAWVVAWVHNSAKVIASSDDYAVKLYEENGKQQMPAFPSLSDGDIKNVLAWVHSQEGQPTLNGPMAQAVAAR